MQDYLGDKVQVELHEGTRVSGYAPNSEDAISMSSCLASHLCFCLYAFLCLVLPQGYDSETAMKHKTGIKLELWMYHSGKMLVLRTLMPAFKSMCVHLIFLNGIYFCS